MVFIVKNGALAVSLAMGAFIMISLMLYITVDSNAKRRQPSYRGALSDDDDAIVRKLKNRVDSLRNQAESNAAILNDLKAKMANVDDEVGKDEADGPILKNRDQIPPPIAKQNRNFCPNEDSTLAHNATSDVQMLSVYDVLPFDNPDGGVWKQGWPIEYDKDKIKKEKRLEVIVVPHSHNDPGWLKTFEGYFEDQTRHILDNMVIHLNEKPDMKFIYAEMSFFEMWWAQQSLETKAQLKKVIDSKQLEIVTGGWVMTDEANSHYFSTIMELFEGYTPKNHWSIDPFGLSPTLAYILKSAAIHHMTIQRVHYSVKKHLAKTKQLEFIWRQLFAGNSPKTDIITHMFPFYSYDAPHSCGPDPAVCCQFDFRRLQGLMHCPWGKNAVPITNENVAERAELLADQYRKKAQLYGFNTILVPLGDDFRYDLSAEWTDQHSNYKKLFEYMNARDDWNINARFGTLDDYFAMLERRLEDGQEAAKREGKLRHSIVRQSDGGLPVLSGDFFTYADRDDHYWSGYFTSRPFYKHMDRSLQHFLMAADIFYTLANWKGKMPEKLASMYDKLVSARRAMSLFQHHDGVTGTAKTPVMADYGEKMAQALSDSKHILEQSVKFLLDLTTSRAEKGLRVDEQHFAQRLPEKYVVEEGSTVIVANPLGQHREEIVCIHVNNIKSRVSQRGNAKEIQQQIGPILYVNLEANLAHFKDKFELCFLANIPAFGLVHFDVIESEDISHKVKIASSGKNFESSIFYVKPIGEGENVQLSNGQLSANFDPKTGYLKSVNNDEKVTDVELSFVRYGARPKNPERKDGGDSLSGAYLFLPDGPATELPSEQNEFVVVHGMVRQYLLVKGPSDAGIRHQISVDINSPWLSIQNNINLGQENGADRGDRAQNAHLGNFELAMRLRVPTIQEDNFYTDLNGFQMIRRRRQSKLPLQAHFYPMPGSAFVEDSNIRVSLLGRQALGVASLANGEMEVMLDRRLVQDDDRGLGQGVEDNLYTESRFRLCVEHFLPSGDARQRGKDTIGFHSLAAHHASLQLHYPPLLITAQLDHSSDVPMAFTGLRQPFPCDVHPVAFRTLSQATLYMDSADGKLTSPDQSHNAGSTAPKQEAALVLHRLGLECGLASAVPPSVVCPAIGGEHSGKLNIAGFFTAQPMSIQKGSLTLLHLEENKQQQRAKDFTLDLEPMELATVKIEF